MDTFFLADIGFRLLNDEFHFSFSSKFEGRAMLNPSNKISTTDYIRNYLASIHESIIVPYPTKAVGLTSRNQEYHG
jgi:hypothetical protein